MRDGHEAHIPPGYVRDGHEAHIPPWVCGRYMRRIYHPGYAGGTRRGASYLGYSRFTVGQERPAMAHEREERER